MHFTIVTPCYRSVHTLEATLRSVLHQSTLSDGTAHLTYWVVEGGAQDGSVEQVQALQAEFAQHPHITLHLISEADAGMYDALAKGLQRAQEGVCAYLNAGDRYEPTAFAVVQSVFTQHPHLQWLCGLEATRAEQGMILNVRQPFRFRSRWIQHGLYNGQPLPFIQQETTFWRSELHAHIDWARLASYRLAGDAYLWHTFARHAPLTIVSALLGAFTVHRGQQSEALDRYYAEWSQHATPAHAWDHLQKWGDYLLWYAPQSLKKRLNPHGLLVFDHATQAWR